MASKIKVDQIDTTLGSGNVTIDPDNNTLVVDTDNTRVGIGTASPSVDLDIQTTGSGTKVNVQTTGAGFNVDLTDASATSRIRHVGTILDFGADYTNTAVSDPRIRFRVGNIPQCNINAHGGIAFGDNTAAANTLDDYEEGTATVTLNGGSGHPITRLTTTSYYTKIGSLVNVNFEFNNVSTTSYSGYISVFGLPFAASSPSGTVRQVCGQIGMYNMGTFSGDGGLFGRLNEGATEIILWNNRSANTWEQVTHSAGSNRYLIMNITYRTDS